MWDSSPPIQGCKKQLNSCILCCSFTDTLLKCHLNGCIRGSEYIYSPHLMALDTCTPSIGEQLLRDKLPQHSPLRVKAWSQALASHPDLYYVTYLLEGIAKGFRIGFNRSHSLCSAHAQSTCQLRMNIRIPAAGSAVRKNVQT